jgi:hypothetical protein
MDAHWDSCENHAEVGRDFIPNIRLSLEVGGERVNPAAAEGLLASNPQTKRRSKWNRS